MDSEWKIYLNRAENELVLAKANMEISMKPELKKILGISPEKIMKYLDAGGCASIKELSEKIDLSTAMLYRAVDELKDMDLISTEDGLKLTDAGKIARM